MALNTNAALVDSSQVLPKVYDATNDGLRVTTQSVAAVASLTSASTGTVIPAFDCVGMKSFNLVSNTTSTVVGAQVLTLEISPSDSANVWIATALTITPSTTNGTVILGTVLTTIARRARVKTAAAITSGTIDIYVMAQAN